MLGIELGVGRKEPLFGQFGLKWLRSMHGKLDLFQTLRINDTCARKHGQVHKSITMHRLKSKCFKTI